jgi:hypothetical protein
MKSAIYSDKVKGFAVEVKKEKKNRLQNIDICPVNFRQEPSEYTCSYFFNAFTFDAAICNTLHMGYKCFTSYMYIHGTVW